MHSAQGNNIRSVEIGKVKARQTTAILKHAIHVFYIGGVEAGDIQACQFLTSFKQSTHVGHFGGVEAGKVEACKTAALSKHTKSY